VNYREVVAVLRQQHAVVIRANKHNLDHHIYANNGSLWGRIWVWPTPVTKDRVDFSYETSDLEVARARRDELFRRLQMCGDDGDGAANTALPLAA
jgi:hypothetical protein